MMTSNIGRAALYGALFAISCGGRASEPFDQTGTAGSGGGSATGGSKTTSGTGGASSGTTTTTSTSSTGTEVGTSSSTSTNGAAGWSVSSDVGTTTGPTPSSGSGGQGGYGNTVSTTTFGATTTTRCGNPGMGGSGGAPPTGPAPGANAVVLTRSQFPPPPPSGTGSTSTTTGNGSVGDDGTQFLNIGTGSLSCQQLYGSGCGIWHLSISIEPSLFKPGKIDLCGISSFSASGPDRGAGDCSFGGGTFDHGTLEILSITNDIVKVRLTGARSSDLDADGQYDVVRCH